MAVQLLQWSNNWDQLLYVISAPNPGQTGSWTYFWIGGRSREWRELKGDSHDLRKKLKERNTSYRIKPEASTRWGLCNLVWRSLNEFSLERATRLNCFLRSLSLQPIAGSHPPATTEAKLQAMTASAQRCWGASRLSDILNYLFNLGLDRERVLVLVQRGWLRWVLMKTCSHVSSSDPLTYDCLSRWNLLCPPHFADIFDVIICWLQQTLVTSPGQNCFLGCVGDLLCDMYCPDENKLCSCWRSSAQREQVQVPTSHGL